MTTVPLAEGTLLHGRLPPARLLARRPVRQRLLAMYIATATAGRTQTDLVAIATYQAAVPHHSQWLVHRVVHIKRHACQAQPAVSCGMLACSLAQVQLNY